MTTVFHWLDPNGPIDWLSATNINVQQSVRSFYFQSVPSKPVSKKMNTESQDLSLRQESEKLTYTINGKKTDSRKLPVENLIGAPKKWRVRDVSEAHVVSIRTAFLSVNEVDIANPLSVIPTEDGKFFVIDGNHRLEAIKRHRLSHPDSFKHVLCHVYEHLRPDEIIAVAVRRNCENNVLPMSEWDKVDLFRRYFKNDSVDTAGLIYGYSMLGITTVSTQRELFSVHFNLFFPFLSFAVLSFYVFFSFCFILLKIM